ncbi:MAG TPA: hypothetical protein VGR37_09585 [Longimicrobiaceae bacterium]|nr:hypothetical protein [Longimicrobiaceae bacterium]
MPIIHTSSTRRGRRPLPRLALAGALALPLAGCSLDSILEVSDPDVVPASVVRDPANLPGVRNGVLGDFAVGFSGQGLNTEALIASVGLFTDEMYHSGTFGTRREVDKRSIEVDNSGMTTVFRNLHRARRAAEAAADLFAAGAPNTASHAEVTNLAGYTYVFFGENYCSGVPFSRLKEDDSFEFGAPQTTEQIFTTALQRFDQGLALATTAKSAPQQNLARIGRARVLLDQGRFADAAAAVQGVPTGYRYLVEHSDNTTRQINGVWQVTFGTRRYGVASNEGGNGLVFRQGSSQSRASQDPRVPYTRTNSRAVDAPFAHFFQLKYPERGSEVVLASGIEARLIEAEAALRSGAAGVATFVAKHNEIRATVGLPPLVAADVSAMTQKEREDLHFRERAFWLYLTANRLSDMRRLVRQYQRNPETVFPTGVYSRLLYRPALGSSAVPDDQLPRRADGTYGNDVAFPIPFDEQNNPQFEQCIDRKA